MDSNLVENAIRPTALGKKNWLFIGEAGQRSAIIYTIIENCRRRSIDLFSYLRDVLSRLPKLTNRQIPELLPTYADDFVVTGASKELLEQKVKPALTAFLAERGLRLSE